jgi:hypothetical protein
MEGQKKAGPFAEAGFKKVGWASFGLTFTARADVTNRAARDSFLFRFLDED